MYCFFVVVVIRLVVSQGGRALHIVFPHQFLDSPEWFGVSTNELFQVTIVSLEEARVLIWHRDKLKLSIINNHFMQAVFDHILGRDVVKKLIQVSCFVCVCVVNIEQISFGRSVKHLQWAMALGIFWITWLIRRGKLCWLHRKVETDWLLLLIGKLFKVGVCKKASRGHIIIFKAPFPRIHWSSIYWNRIYYVKYLFNILIFLQLFFNLCTKICIPISSLNCYTGLTITFKNHRIINVKKMMFQQKICNTYIYFLDSNMRFFELFRF